MGRCPLLPLADRVVLVPDPIPTTKGLITLAPSAQEPTYRGTIAAVGPGRNWPNGATDPVDLEVGDYVLYSKYAGTAVTVNGTEWWILKESDVLARLG